MTAMSILHSTEAPAGTQAIRWCVTCHQRTGASTDVHEAGYPAQVDCHIVDATVSWGNSAMDEARAFVESVPWLTRSGYLPDFGGTDA